MGIMEETVWMAFLVEQGTHVLCLTAQAASIIGVCGGTAPGDLNEDADHCEICLPSLWSRA